MTTRSWLDRLAPITVPSKDDGQRFVVTTRVDYLAAQLVNSAYTLCESPPLARIYGHRDLDPARPAVLVSAHLDEVYDRLWCDAAGDEYHGTFDNSAPNAVLLDLMLVGELPPQAVIAFTGDEEDESRGADQVVDWWSQHRLAPGWPACVIVLDVTEEGYPEATFTIENVFAGRRRKRLRGLSKVADLVRLLRDLTAAHERQVVVEGEADEAWQYGASGLTCWSLCLPSRVLGREMHDAAGLAIRHSSLDGYRTALRAVLIGLVRQAEGALAR